MDIHRVEVQEEGRIALLPQPPRGGHDQLRHVDVVQRHALEVEEVTIRGLQRSEIRARGVVDVGDVEEISGERLGLTL